MSKLIDLIGRLGQQSAPPIGFGALAGKVEAAPTMALIATTSPKVFTDHLASVSADAVDAVIFHNADRGSGSGMGITASELSTDVIAELDGIDDMIWGAACDRNTLSDDVNALAAAGCDFFTVDIEFTPSEVVNYPDIATLVTLSEPVDRETAAALRAMQVAGTINTSARDMSDLRFGQLVELHKIAASTGGAMLVALNEEPSLAALTAFREVGVDGLVVPLSDGELVSLTAQRIRELPARRPPKARGLQATAPRNS